MSPRQQNRCVYPHDGAFSFALYVGNAGTTITRLQTLFIKREAPLAVLVTLRGVGDTDARRGDKLDARTVAFNPKPL